MKSITKPSLFDNLGGVLNIWAVPASVVTISGQTVTISSSTNVVKLYCTEDDTKAVFNKKTENGNIFYEVDISGVTFCKTSADADILAELEQGKWVVVAEDGNNVFKIFGTPTERLSFESEEDTGKDTSERNQVPFSFSGKTQLRPFFITNPF